MTSFIERRWRFEFDDAVWKTQQYDKHQDYRQLVAPVQNTKAVDFLAVSATSEPKTVLFLEVSDFSRHEQDFLDRSRNDLGPEFLQKVRDSFAGVALLACVPTSDEFFRSFVTALAAPRVKVSFVLWLGPISSQANSQVKSRLLHLNNQFKKLAGKWRLRSLACVNIREAGIAGLEIHPHGDS